MLPTLSTSGWIAGTEVQVGLISSLAPFLLVPSFPASSIRLFFLVDLPFIGVSVGFFSWVSHSSLELEWVR